MTRNTLAAVIFAALGFLALASVGRAADATTSQKSILIAAEEIFSGTVMQFTDRSLTVTHTVPGRPTVTREFVRDAKTTIEGKLRSNVRVTVRYRALGNGEFVAVHIIVRSVGRAA